MNMQMKQNSTDVSRVIEKGHREKGWMEERQSTGGA